MIFDLIFIDFLGNARVAKIIDSIKNTFEDKIYLLKAQDDDIILDLARSNKSVINQQNFSKTSIDQIEQLQNNIQCIECINDVDIQVCIRFEYLTGIVSIQGMQII